MMLLSYITYIYEEKKIYKNVHIPRKILTVVSDYSKPRSIYYLHF